MAAMSRSSRFRSSSPGSKRIIDPMRASTGTVATGSDYYASPASYYANDGLLSPVSAERYADYRGGAEPRYSSSKVDVQPISSSTYRDGGQSTKLRTEYAVRPRQRSNTFTEVDSNRRPLSVVIPSSSSSAARPPSIITSAYDTSNGPTSSRYSYYRDDPDRYITPASSTGGRRHRRVHSTDYTDPNRLDPTDRRARADRAYRTYRQTGSSKQASRSDPRNWDDEDYYNAVSYTKPSEQFERDSAARSHQRASARGSRPLSIAGEAHLPQSPMRKEVRSGGPPPTYRGLDKVYDDERPYGSSRSSRRADNDVYLDPKDARRYSVHRNPVSLHQQRDDGYTSYNEDYYDSRPHHRHRDDKSGSGRHHHDSRDSKKHGASELLAPIVGGLAGLGLGARHPEGSRDSDRATRNEHRSRGSEKTRSRRESESDDADYVGSKGKEKVGRDGDERRSQPKSRDLSKRRDQGNSEDSSYEEGKRPQRRERSSRPHRESGSSGDSSPRRRQPDTDLKARPRPKDVSPTVSKPGSPDQDGDGRPRKTVTVEPAPAKEPEAPPKSILKPPREKFPEDENPIREGVAPLKDAQKKGIPPGARWTKIDRRLVNPAALELGHERFEERNDYVIVLRVLTKEEIQAYALKTKEIRGKG